MISRLRCLLTSLLLVIFISGIGAAAERIQNFTFEDIHSMDIRTVSGDIRICPGNDAKLKVELKNDLDDPDRLDPKVEADQGELSIEEHFTGSHVRGEIYWTVYLPKSAELKRVKCRSASGNMSFEGFKTESIRAKSASGEAWVDAVYAKEIEISTASGSITVKASDVDFITIKSASGDILLDAVRSKEQELSTASGSITVENGKIEEQSTIQSASGDVELDLPQLPPVGLVVSSASSDVTLKVPDFGDNFSMTISKGGHGGRIKCPFAYTDKTTFRNDDDDDNRMDRYYVKHGEGGPDIKLKTYSGTIRIETDTKGK
ncbi:MAG: DUF4097 family beta strand repeat-containing protein [Candidatus Zixiibacteriota bacterium]